MQRSNSYSIYQSRPFRHTSRGLALWSDVIDLFGLSTDEAGQRMRFQRLAVLLAFVLAPLSSWSSPPADPASPAVALSAGISLADRQRSEAMDALAHEEKGLLVICASKQAAESGPEMLEVFDSSNRMVSVKIGEAKRLDSRSASVPGKDIVQLSGTIPFAETPEVTTTRYIAEIPYPAGEYAFTIKRMFPCRDHGKEHLSVLRDHGFKRIRIQAGKAAILSFFWQDDERFGDTTDMSESHRKLVETVAGTLRTHLSAVHQHTDL